jgi:hypothetical protein
MSALLTRVKRAAVRKRRAQDEYRAAVLAARAEHTFQDIADAAGVRYQNIQKIVRRLQGEES